MPAHILGQVGKRYNHDGLEFWAEDGLIFWEDQNTGEFCVVTPSDFKQRAIALWLEAKRADQGGHIDQRDNLNDWVVKMHAAWKDAKDQGDPTDPKVALQKLKARRKASLITGAW
jgi:hypothetical protein